jgi:hypothetical protein
MPTHLGDTSKEVNDTLKRRRCQPDNAKQDFRLVSPHISYTPGNVLHVAHTAAAAAAPLRCARSVLVHLRPARPRTTPSPAAPSDLPPLARLKYCGDTVVPPNISANATPFRPRLGQDGPRSRPRHHQPGRCIVPPQQTALPLQPTATSMNRQGPL